MCVEGGGGGGCYLREFFVSMFAWAYHPPEGSLSSMFQATAGP